MHMSDTEPVKEEISPESTGEKTSAGEPEQSTASAVPDAASKKKRTHLLIMTGVAVIVVLVAVGAYLLLSGPVASTGDTVAILYNESFDNGTVYLSNMNSTTPLVFTIGNSSVITGVQDAVTGMRVGDIKTVDISAADAYGPYDPGLVQTLNRTGPIKNTTFTPGQYFTVYYKPINAYSTVKILNVTEKTVTWDANNPLAGYNLTFTIKLASITQANTTQAGS
jgi:peptidylprolyl isomerase